MFKIVVFVPKLSAEKVKEAMFTAGAGRQGAYERCSFECEGMGQFHPLPGAHPSIGKVGELERVPEIRVEMLCPPEKIRNVIQALRDAHPYEEPAFDVLRLLTENELF